MPAPGGPERLSPGTPGRMAGQVPPVSKCPLAAGGEPGCWRGGLALPAAGAAMSSSCLRRGWCVVSTSRRASVTWVLPSHTLRGGPPCTLQLDTPRPPLCSWAPTVPSALYAEGQTCSGAGDPFPRPQAPQGLVHTRGSFTEATWESGA